MDLFCRYHMIKVCLFVSSNLFPCVRIGQYSIFFLLTVFLVLLFISRIIMIFCRIIFSTSFITFLILFIFICHFQIFANLTHIMYSVYISSMLIFDEKIKPERCNKTVNNNRFILQKNTFNYIFFF